MAEDNIPYALGAVLGNLNGAIIVLEGVKKSYASGDVQEAATNLLNVESKIRDALEECHGALGEFQKVGIEPGADLA